MVVTTTGKVLGLPREVSKPEKEEREVFQPSSNYAFKEISAIREYKIIHQLSLLKNMKQLNHAIYTKRDIQSLMSDIQHAVDVVEDYLIQTCLDNNSK